MDRAAQLFEIARHEARATPCARRKNWMLYGSASHPESAAAIFSPIASCRLHSIDPQYFDEVTRVLPFGPEHRHLEFASRVMATDGHALTSVHDVGVHVGDQARGFRDRSSVCRALIGEASGRQHRARGFGFHHVLGP